jgi:Zn-dependent protease
MGPIFGFTLAIPLFGLYLLLKDPLYAAMAGFVAIFNWFNLLPFYPFDGGNIVKTILSSFHWRLEKLLLDLSFLCFFVSGLASIYFEFWLTGLFFIIFGIVVLIARLRWQKGRLPKLTIVSIFVSIICYLIAMVILLGFPMWILNLPGVLEAAQNINRFK